MIRRPPRYTHTHTHEYLLTFKKNYRFYIIIYPGTLLFMSKLPLDTSHKHVIYITPFLQPCEAIVIALIPSFLCANGGRFAFWCLQVRHRSCASVHLQRIAACGISILLSWNTSKRLARHSHSTHRQSAAFSNAYYVLNSIGDAPTQAQTVLCALTSTKFGDDWQVYLIMQTVQEACVSPPSLLSLINIVSELKGQTLHPVTR